ncbi:NACHT domain-containing protein [Pedobacter rhizosphaerae]|uniref:Restriction endonuclease n=1 Tax=Pedobacter rhizosphaerae TaxID=390241 RepID=A0A1H9N2V4_9SPHI|nr:hypothetical protein [Pedobacter rhizosphaerae]SER30262.1 hypothetical protein SAMN04488023_10712 [Pedobacter rhizosphaerae]
MKDSALNWDNLGWDKFESLVMHLAAEQFSGLSFSRYLKQGNSQHGVDITSFNGLTGKHICIQCKDTSLDLKALETVSKKFISGDFHSKSDNFILATTADLQNKKSQDYIRTQEEYFHKHGISYACWDINKLNDLLKHHFRIVHHYFSLSQAKDHCFPAAPLDIKITPVKNFIPRQIMRLEDNIQELDIWSTEENKKIYNLTEVITAHPMETKSICLLADPYEGKSMLLFQTIYELQKHPQQYFPLLLSLKTLPIIPIKELLSSLFRTWDTTPAIDTIIFIDGLDEVSSDSFVDTLNHINLFRAEYPSISIVITCRLLFFHHYKVSSSLSDFDYFILRDLSFYYHQTYIEKHLRERKEKFLVAMRDHGIMDLLGKPFYLSNLVQWYKKDPKSIPRGKIEIINKFIEETLSPSESRRLSGGKILDHNRAKYRKTIQRLALALQLSGLNAAPKDFLQQLFDPTEIELLQNSPVISHSGKYWGFYSAIFQEQLAAMELKGHPFEKIYRLVTIGSKIQKIKTKWIQTIASYLSMKGEGSTESKELINLIEKDNPEIFTICDSSKFSAAFRLWAITSIIERCMTKKIRPLLVRESVIANFIDGEKTIVSYLINILYSAAADDLKITCCRILREFPVDSCLHKNLETVSQEQLLGTSSPYYAQLLFELLAKNNLSGSTFINLFISRSSLIKEQECRDGIYKLLIALGLVDHYYDFGIEGFTILIDYNKNVSHHASERNLERFFLQTCSSVNLNKLYSLLCTRSWLSFYRNKASASGHFIKGLAKLSAELYKHDKSILLAVMDFFIAGEKRYFNREIRFLGTFFELTKTTGLALELYLLKSDGKHYHYDFSTLIAECDSERILRLIHDGDISRNDLDACIAALFRGGREKEAEHLRSMSRHVLKPNRENSNSNYQIYLEAELTRKQNDYKFLQSKDSFRAALECFFAHFKSKTITVENLYKEPERRVKRTHLESNHLLSFIGSRKDTIGKVKLTSCLELLDEPGYFEHWRANKILHSHQSDSPEDRQLIKILESFYFSMLEKADFATAYRLSDASSYQSNEELLVDIWKELGFDTPDEIILEFTWMMDEGIKGISNAKLNKRKSLAGRILTHFQGKEELLEEKILKNFHKGIHLESTIASHLEICERLAVSDAPDIIISLIAKKLIGVQITYHALQIFKKLNGDLELLLPYFHNLSIFENYNFERLVSYLIVDFADQVYPRLKMALSSDLVGEEDKMTAAKYLAHSGQHEGFSYIIRYMENTTTVPYDIQSDYQIWKVDTAWGLTELSKIFHLYLDERFHSSKFYRSPDRFIIEILKGLAKKSEQDLLLVISFMENQSQINQEKYPKSANDLIWYTQTILEDFRAEENGQQLALEQIKEFIDN